MGNKLVKMGAVYRVEVVVVGIDRRAACSTRYSEYSRGPAARGAVKQ